MAGDFAGVFSAADWATLAGIWHDLGKYSAEFQRYIAQVSGYDPEAHIEGGPGRVDHSTAGALHAIAEFGLHGRILAYLIAGHHAGLPDWDSAETGGKALSIRLDQSHLLTRVLSQSVPETILQQTKPSLSIPGGRDGFALWVRMLFSCLVDADFLDTEAFMDNDGAERRGSETSLCDLLVMFNRHMEQKSQQAKPGPVNQIRAQVLQQCRARAREEAPGIFSLTVPTGGGKTLSSMAFALQHAIKHNKRRVIYVIPYTSIIEQTANIFRDVFANVKDAVVEHHSNLDPDTETAKSRLATENWDAPIIVTTNVQFFESLFAAKTSRTRKLHNIVNSIVVLDEAQLLPPEFLQPILDVMNQLAKNYGVTFVLSTATQPALNSRSGFGWKFKGLDNVREIMSDPDGLYRDLERVTLQLPIDFQQRQSWEEIAAELSQYESLLCIVNTRNDCRELYRLMPKGTLHLSALMCGEHRSRVISDIKVRLERGEVVRVISTQLVEAGVDVDFPVVYRAMAGLDSIAQAAGRCNREGKLQRGKVVVFIPPKPVPSGILRKAAESSISQLSGYNGDPMARGLFKTFFESLYGKTDLDKHGISDLLKVGDKLEVQFRSAAEKFRLIDEEGYQPVFVLYGDSPALIGKLEKDGPERWLMRKLQRYTVNLPQYQFKQLLEKNDMREIREGFSAQTSEALYDENLGVLVDDAVLPPNALVMS